MIGLGSAGRRHVGNLLSLGCSVYGIDTHPSAKARTLEQYPYIDIIDGFAPSDHFDAWIIATPWDKHLDWVELAIQNRRAFFTEKPLGSLEQLPRWREIAAMDLPVNQVGYMLRFHPDAQRIHAIHPTRGKCEVLCDMRKWPGSARDGVPILELSHEIDLALWFGAPAHVCEVEPWPVRKTFYLGDGWDWEVTVKGSAHVYRRYWIGENHRTAIRSQFESPEELGDEMYRAELAHFLDCVRNNTPTICPLADGLRVLEVCQQVEQMTRQPA